MQQTDPQSSTVNVLQNCRRLCAIEILGGDATSQPQQLISQRLTDARFSPPEIWQQAADALSQTESLKLSQQTAFEEQAVCRAIDEFSRQYFLLTPQARLARVNTLLQASTDFAALHWRVQRLSRGVAFRPDALLELTAKQHRTALLLCRLFTLPIGFAATEARKHCRSICRTRQTTSKFLNGIQHLKSLPGFEEIITQTRIERKVRRRSQRSRSGRKQPMIQQRLRQSSEAKPAATSIPWIWLVFGVLAILRMLPNAATVDPYRPNLDYSSPSNWPAEPPKIDAFSVPRTRIDPNRKSSYVSPRFTDPPSSSDVAGNGPQLQLRDLIQQHSANTTPPTIPPMSISSELLQELRDKNGDAQKIIQRHIESLKVKHQLRPLPLPNFPSQLRRPIRKPIRPPSPPADDSLPAEDSALSSPQTGHDD